MYACSLLVSRLLFVAIVLFLVIVFTLLDTDWSNLACHGLFWVGAYTPVNKDALVSLSSIRIQIHSRRILWFHKTDQSIYLTFSEVTSNTKLAYLSTTYLPYLSQPPKNIQEKNQLIF